MTVFPERRRPAGCVSDLGLDLWLAGELDAEATATTRWHLVACPICRARFGEILAARAAFAALPALPALEGTATADRRRWRLSASSVAFAAAAAAGVALFVLAGRTGDERRSDPTGTRTKGGGRLGFFVKHGEAVRRGGPGEVVEPGDVLRFAVGPVGPDRPYVAVLSFDGAGRASVYFPKGAWAARVRPGADVALPLATVLDDTLGREVLYGLFCASPVLLEPIRAAIEAHPHARSPASGCEIDRIEIEKRGPP